MIEWKVDTLANTMVAETPLCNYKITYLKGKVQLEFDDMFKEFDHDKDARDYAEKYHEYALIRFGYKEALHHINTHVDTSGFFANITPVDRHSVKQYIKVLTGHLRDKPDLDIYYPEIND